jgi:hypothetical protein
LEFELEVDTRKASRSFKGLGSLDISPCVI